MFDRISGRLLAWQLGDRSAETLRILLKRLKMWNVKVCCTDDWPTYAKEIETCWPMAHHVVTKAETVALERNNSDTRHGYGRFHRKTKIVSKSLEMVELPLHLFAKLRVDGGIQLLINWRLSLLTLNSRYY